MNFWPKGPHGDTLGPGESQASTREAVAALPTEWRTAAWVLAVVLVGYGLAFWGTAAHTVATWQNSVAFNHGFLILPICAYLIWERRRRLTAVAPSPFPPALALAVTTAFAWMLGSLADVRVVEQFALVAMIYGSVLAILGPRAVRVLVFPLFYLIFAVPFGESLVPYLQDLTAAFVVNLLRMIDVPVFVDGIFISIPTGNFVVAEACSGIRYLIAMVALGFLYADLNYRSLARKTAFVVFSFVVPVVANGVRAFGIVYLAYLTDHTVAVGADHILYGWVFFAIVTLILIGIGTTFREAARSEAVAPHPSVAPRGAGTPGRSALARTIAVAAILLAAGGAVRAYADYANDAGRAALGETLRMPEAPAGWSRFDHRVDGWQPDFESADETRLATYVRDGKAVHMFVALYRHQRPGAELVSANNSITGAGKQTWARAGSGEARATVDGAPLSVVSTRMVRNEAGRLAWHWYWLDGRYTSNSYVAKALETKVKLLDLPRGAAVIAVAADYAEGPDEAAALLDEFLRGLAPMAPGLARAAGQ
jgi:exosortase A